ncbi:hypothetical protein COLO4_33456 [Corchorus olitorius]|uniref:Uncharacterized protein n=1 Tax=Corchorus olitorius TaxID=93759 RepID=A0A1R3GTB4_9ROSI|nr:hypothetical protein COLO4_33456 [Corchorus olitorius]
MSFKVATSLPPFSFSISTQGFDPPKAATVSPSSGLHGHSKRFLVSTWGAGNKAS